MLLFSDSFDHYSTAHLFRKWTVPVNTVSLSGLHEPSANQNSILPIGRCNSNGLRVIQTDAFTNIACGPHLTLAPATTSGVVGFAFKVNSFNGVHDLLRIMSNNTIEWEGAQITLQVLQNGRIQIYRGAYNFVKVVAFGGGPSSANALAPRTSSDILATSTVAVQQGSFYFCELVFTIGGAGSVQCFLNGDSICSASGVDTDYTNTGTWDGIQLGKVQEFTNPSLNATNYLDFDDLYVIDTSGARNNSRLGDVKVEALFAQTDAVAPGATLQWTPVSGSDHGAMVDEVTPDDDTTYNSATTVGFIDTYNYPSLAIGTGTIKAVTVLPCATKDDSTTKKIATVVRHGGTNYAASGQSVSTSSYRYHPQIYETNPGTSTDWTVADINAAEFGVKVDT